ncbi:UDP-glucose iridoid glucosyltransferase-like isoform X4 [Malus sylvestris]|uniref:UDP-glucose iridoid glucosyltransferase-like isoform X4 n=1 Tax=Malus sylvestris TaxID=3752 RepID=UPI0021ACFF33|nr:UDP-glucose iridoid glucosyltransferase-like isoform X4 [Malus sylvestris]
MEMEKKTQSTRLVLVPCPYQGHINPMLQLGSFLHSKGFSITVIHTQFNSPNPSNHPDFTFFPIQDGLTAEEISSENAVAILLAINANCTASFRQRLTQVMEQEPENKITSVIHDDLMYFTEAVAKDLNIPNIMLRTTSVTNFLARTALLRLHSKGHIPFPDSQSLSPLPDVDHLRLKDLPTNNFDTVEKYSELAGNAHDVRTASAIVWNTTDCLEQSSLAQIKQQCPVPIFSIGPLHKIEAAASSSLLEEDTSCIGWLDKQSNNAVIYVSLGSVASISEKELAEMAWGLANSKQPFLWVIRPGSVGGSNWMELLPKGFTEAIGERGYIVKWAPQRKVLSHRAIGGFWSHCGWNSTLESLSEGIPMICLPSFGDQKVHSRYVSLVWKVGLHLDNELERGEIERAVRKLMVDADGDVMRGRAKDLKEKIEVSLRKGGSSYEFLNKLVELIMSL